MRLKVLRGARGCKQTDGGAQPAGSTTSRGWRASGGVEGVPALGARAEREGASERANGYGVGMVMGWG